jgi:hypothetical protein
MPFKGTFNKKENSKNISIEQFEKQVLRINTLEVQIKELMRFEKQVRLSLLEAVKEEKTKTLGIESKNKLESYLTKTEYNQELNLFSRKLNELKKRISMLEQQISTIETSTHDYQHHKKHNQEIITTEEWIGTIVERFLSEKYKSQIQKEEKIHARLEELEKAISIQTMQESNVLKSNPNERDSNQDAVLSSFERRKEEVEHKEPGVELFHSLLQQGEESIEKNENLIVSKEEAKDRSMTENLPFHTENNLMERVEKLIEKYNNLRESELEGGSIPDSQQRDLGNMSLEGKQEVKEVIVKQEPILKTIYIENLNLDKYEQHNNFAQVGIKELSGALNIGATYGIDAIPKKVIDSVQEDIETIKANKEQMKKNENTKNPLHTENSRSPATTQEEKGFGDVTLEVMEEHKNIEDQSIMEGREPFSPLEEGVFTKVDIEEVENQASAEKASGEELSSSQLEDELYTDIDIEDDSSNGENFS